MTMLEEIIATTELCGNPISEIAAQLLVEELRKFPEKQIRPALSRCRRELKGRLTVAEVLTRIDDGRPSPNEAWASLPWSEEVSATVNDEIMQAMSTAQPAWENGDKQGARLAFIESYMANVQAARMAGQSPKWFVSFGYSGNPQATKEGRDAAYELGQASHSAAIDEGIRRNRLDPAGVADTFPHLPNVEEIRKITGGTQTAIPEEVKALVRGIGKKMAAPLYDGGKRMEPMDPAIRKQMEREAELIKQRMGANA